MGGRAGGYDDLTIVIPVLNEAEAIGMVIDEILGVGIPRERILVVDGGSVDGTVEIALSRGVRVVRQEGRGKGLAIRTALKHVRTEYMLVMDGDYTYPAKYIPELYRVARKGYDLVIGARIPCKGSQPLIYRLGNRLLTWFFNILFGTRLRDVLSGMYVVRVRRLRGLGFKAWGFGIESEIAAHIACTTGRIAEVPIEYRRRVGRKKLRIFHGLLIALDMVKLAWMYNPTFLIFVIGSLLLIPGLILGAWAAYDYLVRGVVYYGRVSAALTLTIAGFISLLLSILALYMKRMEYRIMWRISDVERRLEELGGLKEGVEGGADE